MELITVRELFKNTEKYVDKEIEIGGWVRNKRPSAARFCASPVPSSP